MLDLLIIALVLVAAVILYKHYGIKGAIGALSGLLLLLRPKSKAPPIQTDDRVLEKAHEQIATELHRQTAETEEAVKTGGVADLLKRRGH